MRYLGIDIGGTFIKYALINEDMRIQYKWKKETRIFNDKDSFYDYICEDLLENDFVLVGVSAPGVIKDHTVISKTGPTTCIMYHTNIEREIQARIHASTYVMNDAKAAAYCEYHLGASKNTTSSAYLIIGTGLGGCSIEDGVIKEGRDHLAGEFSCLPFSVSLGRIITAAHFASMSALIEIYNKFSRDPVKYGDEVCRRYLENEKSAIWAMNDWILNIAAILINMSLTYNPDVICIGGGISEETWFFELLSQTFMKYFPPRFEPLLTTKIVPCHYGNDANLIGPILYGREKLEQCSNLESLK